MAKYRVKTAGIFPGFGVGDIVSAEEELVPGLKAHLEPYAGDEEVTKKSEIINLSRDDLKARATAAGVDFAPNITTEKLQQLVIEAEKKVDA